MPRKDNAAYETENGVFPQRLKEIMKERGVNQTTLAAKITEKYITIQRQTISLYMSGQSKPDTERLAAIARVLDVSADWLLGISEYKMARNGEESIQSIGVPEQFVEFLKFYQNNLSIQFESIINLIGQIDFLDAMETFACLNCIPPEPKAEFNPECAETLQSLKETIYDVSNGTHYATHISHIRSGILFEAQEKFNLAMRTAIKDLLEDNAK